LRIQPVYHPVSDILISNFFKRQVDIELRQRDGRDVFDNRNKAPFVVDLVLPLFLRPELRYKNYPDVSSSAEVLLHREGPMSLRYLPTTQLVFGLLFLLSACSQQAADPEYERLQARAQNVTIIRDDFGVPHIYAKSDADAVFGMLYAQSEDDFNRVEQNYIWATGRLAEVEGEEALYSDLRARLYMTVDEAKAAYAAAPEWLKELCDAFADGINFYLYTHADVKPRLLTHFEPWMPMYFSEGIESVPLEGIEGFYGGEIRTADLQSGLPPRRRFEETSGSNGFAIAGDLTESGNALLLINPHTSFFFRGEIHVVSEEGLNAYGAVTWGQFFVYQGFNENTGWMHTSTRVDFMDEFIEDVQLLYRYGDEKRPVEVLEVTLKYKDGEQMSERTFPMYRTHHGPVTHDRDGSNRSSAPS
jgi:acyl-homoserine lactone acylase PvdQ